MLLRPAVEQYRYVWPDAGFPFSTWRPSEHPDFFVRDLPETREELKEDSRWPAFFPSPICLVTTTDGKQTGLEKVVGASIVNRFPYVLALSFCKDRLSDRHHARAEFMRMLEAGQSVAVQYLPPGPLLDRAMNAIAAIPDENTSTRIQKTDLPTRKAATNDSLVFADAYMVYEGRLVKPMKDFEGAPMYATPWTDIGSHRVYYLEIQAIQLRQDIAKGETQIHWRSLPAKKPGEARRRMVTDASALLKVKYQKGYNPHYAFPSPNTVAFEADAVEHGMCIKHLPPLPEDQVEVDNDRARWPCFFPSSAGMITTWADDMTPNLMPCGSTTILSRHPMVVTPCVSYARINERYAPRATLEMIRKTKRFGCGVPYLDDDVISGMKHAGNVSYALEREKVANSGFEVWPLRSAPLLTDLPVHFDCKVTGEVRLGTHIMFLGEVERIFVRKDVTPKSPLEWCPWADVSS